MILKDASAFTLLYERYIRPVYSLCAHLLGPANAEEAVQEIFLTLWLRADRYDPARGPFRPWFMAVARHRALRDLRRRGPERQLTAASEIEHLFTSIVDARSDVENAAWRREEDRAVLDALSTLPPEQRQALVLAYFGGLSQSAIAQRLGWPLGTVKKRTQLGLRKLRAALAEYTSAGPRSLDAAPAPLAATALRPSDDAFGIECDDGL